MYNTLLALSLAAVSLIGFSGAPVFAADDMSPVRSDCSKASTMMQKTMAPPPGTMMSGDHPMGVDAAYLKSMKAMLDHQTTMAKMEADCGSNDTVKTNAKKTLDEMRALNDEVTNLLRSIGV